MIPTARRALAETAAMPTPRQAAEATTGGEKRGRRFMRAPAGRRERGPQYRRRDDQPIPEWPGLSMRFCPSQVYVTDSCTIRPRLFAGLHIMGRMPRRHSLIGETIRPHIWYGVRRDKSVRSTKTHMCILSLPALAREQSSARQRLSSPPSGVTIFTAWYVDTKRLSVCFRRSCRIALRAPMPWTRKCRLTEKHRSPGPSKSGF